MHVRHDDRNDDVTQLDIALRMVGLNVDYTTSDLIYMMLKALAERGDDFSLQDAAAIQTEHANKWERYADVLATEENSSAESEINPDEAPDLNLSDIEEIAIKSALAKYNGHRGKAAKSLGMSERTLHRRLNKLNM
jgi:DNA-binding NtrC family response regulator